MVAYYMRLSSADEVTKESDSIENQRKTLMNYQQSCPDLGGNGILNVVAPHEEYIDDGYTGINFKRPGWSRLIEDCKKGKIDTILVRDASRIGRNHIEVEEYLQIILPVLKIRVICLQENYDSKISVTNEAISLANIINDYYSKDISTKIRGSFKQRWKNGEMTSRTVPYGYVCNDLKKGYEIDPEAAEVVKRIFHEAAKGRNPHHIARSLDKDGILLPYTYILVRDGRKSAFDETMDQTRIWKAQNVIDIVKNETYTGVRIVNRKKRKNCILGQEQCRYRNDHEALVSETLFEKANDAISRNANGKHMMNQSAEEPLKSNIFKGLIRCGNCHRMMTFSGGTYKCRYESKICSSKRFVEEGIKWRVWQILKTKAEQAKRILDGQEEIPVADGIQDEIKRLEEKQLTKYEEMCDGKITMDEFSGIHNEIRKKIDELEQRKIVIAGKTGYRVDLEFALKPLAEILEDRELTRDILVNLVEVVYVFENDIKVVSKAEQFLMV